MIKKSIIILFFGLLLSAGQASRSFAAAAAAAVKPAIRQYPYSINRNPFKTFLYSPEKNFSSKEGGLPLLRFDLSSMKAVGIMESRGVYYGMIKTPDGRSYIVTVGSLVGIDRARIIYMESDKIVLREKIYNAIGQVKAVTVFMKLKGNN